MITVQYKRRIYGPDRSWQSDTEHVQQFAGHTEFLAFIFACGDKGWTIHSEKVL